MSLDIERIKALCFDVDGTLSDTDDRWVHSLQRFLLPVRWMLPGGDAKAAARHLIMAAETPGNLLYQALDHLGLDEAVGHIFNRISRRDHKVPGRFWIIPGIKECLEKLAQSYPMSVVSARGAEGTDAFLEEFELKPLFSTVVTAQTCTRTKPYPDPVLHAAEKMNVAPEACLMIGDTTVDIRAGKRAGAQTVGVLCGFGTERELRRAGADLILASTAHLVHTLGEAAEK